jgi:hypothetical protein
MVLAFNKVLAQEVIATSGNTISNSQGEVSYTVGQIVFTTNTASEGSIAQGVHQTYDSETLSNSEPTVNFEVLIYPNPTKNDINIKVNSSVQNNLNYELFDIQGRIIHSQRVEFDNTKISLSTLPASIYLLQIKSDNKILKTFKIIKN